MKKKPARNILRGISVEFLPQGIESLAQHSILYHFHIKIENLKVLQ